MRGRCGEGEFRCMTQSCPCAPSEQRPTGTPGRPPPGDLAVSGIVTGSGVAPGLRIPPSDPKPHCRPATRTTVDRRNADVQGSWPGG